MEFKGAPAPWIATKREFFIELYDDNGNYVGLTNSKANAHLIATAPELLEQLIRLRNKIASYKPDDDDDLDIVDAVIAKALGQQ
ncbi:MULTISPECIES: hypothetical protein [Proteus]|uniref:hypothetical protein n=1 Tax=Proteus TaxID=583 RepID=UPI0013D6FE5B|nr:MULTISPECIES: hypothetical protein [Proteus]MCT8264750.1 hypothetical protein [Proteus terrae]HBC6355094.1 hypothetical protein [Proteus mirabilis]